MGKRVVVSVGLGEADDDLIQRRESLKKCGMDVSSEIREAWRMWLRWKNGERPYDIREESEHDAVDFSTSNPCFTPDSQTQRPFNALHPESLPSNPETPERVTKEPSTTPRLWLGFSPRSSRGKRKGTPT